MPSVQEEVNVKIKKIEIGHLSIPLKTPFKTALRTVTSVEDVIVRISTDNGLVGYGEAPPTAVITGDTIGSIRSAIETVIGPAIMGMEVDALDEVLEKIHGAMVNNASAKAAVDMAVYDLFGQCFKAPVYKLIGGYRKSLTTDITISVNDTEQMVKDSLSAVNRGFEILKVKVGKGSDEDMNRLRAIRDSVPKHIRFRVDANQGWQPKEAVKLIHRLEDEGFAIDLVEQPVVAGDIAGLKYVTDHVSTLILADEAVFSPRDAIRIMETRAADLINIKLMKTGGFYNALKICAAAETYGFECMVGCMLESKLSVTAAAHLAAAKKVITRVDLDGPALCNGDPIIGGAVFDEAHIYLPDRSGLGIEAIKGVTFE